MLAVPPGVLPPGEMASHAVLHSSTRYEFLRESPGITESSVFSIMKEVFGKEILQNTSFYVLSWYAVLFGRPSMKIRLACPFLS